MRLVLALELLREIEHRLLQKAALGGDLVDGYPFVLFRMFASLAADPPHPYALSLPASRAMAACIHIAVALIAFLLLRLAEAAQQAVKGPTRLLEARARQSDAPQAHRSAAPYRTGDRPQLKSIGAPMELNRTAVGQARA